MTDQDLALDLTPPPGDGPPPNVLPTEMVEIHRLTPYFNNPRRNEHVTEELAEGIKEFGWRQPIVVDKDFVIIIGHTRFASALANQEWWVPVHVAHDLPPAKVRALRMFDNKIAERAEWDYGKVQEEMQALEDEQYDLLKTGFRQYEIEPIRAADWNPVEAEGTLGATGGRDEGPLLQGDLDMMQIFQREQLETCIHAVRRYRAKANSPEATFAEAVAKICHLYRPTKA